MNDEELKIISYLNLLELPLDKPISNAIINSSFSYLSIKNNLDAKNIDYNDFRTIANAFFGKSYKRNHS